MKIVILLGATGYIGKVFCYAISDRGWCLHAVPHEGLDFKTLKLILEAAKDNSDSVIVVNCAAYVCKPSVELNDQHKEETLLGNLVFPTTVANACEATGTPLLHVSTGCLFFYPAHAIHPDFREENYFKFDEKQEPHLTLDKGAGAYVASKELAERVVRQYDHHWIARVRLPFDNQDNPRNYLTKLLTYPRIVDVRNSMSHRGDFVKACLDMIETGVPFGTYNVTNPGAMWTHEIADVICKAWMKQQFDYWPIEDFVKTSRKTPMSVAELDVSKLLATGVKIRTVQEAIEDSVENWKPSLLCSPE